MAPDMLHKKTSVLEAVGVVVVWEPLLMLLIVLSGPSVILVRTGLGSVHLGRSVWCLSVEQYTGRVWWSLIIWRRSLMLLVLRSRLYWIVTHVLGKGVPGGCVRLGECILESGVARGCG